MDCRARLRVDLRKRTILKAAGLRALILISACCVAPGCAAAQDPSTAASGSDSLDLLSFEELVKLSETAKPEGLLARRLDAVLSSIPIHNDYGAPPHNPKRTVWGAWCASECGISDAA
jgi:hypothetical protein